MSLGDFRYAIFVAHLLAILLCSMLLLSIWYYWYAVGMKIASKTIISFSMIAIILYSLSSISLTITSIGIWDILAVSDLFGVPIWTTSQICTYLVFTNRFKISFNKTKYALSNNMYYIFYAIMIVYVLLAYITVIIYILYRYTPTSINRTDYQDSLIALNLFVVILDLILSIGLLWLFLSKLVALHIDIGEQLNPRYKQMSIIHVMSKMNILTIISVLSSQIFVFWSGIINSLYRFDIIDEYKYLDLLNVLYIIWAFEHMINSLCIYLSFEFAAKLYNKMCSKCHHCCVRVCKNWTRKQTIKIKVAQMKDKLMRESMESPLLINENGSIHTENGSTDLVNSYSKAIYHPPTRP